MKSKHKDLLNDLSDMGYSPAYAARRSVLRNAETLIVAQEQQIEALHAQLAGYRKIGCASHSDVALLESGANALCCVYPAPQQFMTEWKTLYAKD